MNKLHWSLDASCQRYTQINTCAHGLAHVAALCCALWWQTCADVPVSLLSELCFLERTLRDKVSQIGSWGPNQPLSCQMRPTLLTLQLASENAELHAMCCQRAPFPGMCLDAMALCNDKAQNSGHLSVLWFMSRRRYHPRSALLGGPS